MDLDTKHTQREVVETRGPARTRAENQDVEMRSQYLLGAAGCLLSTLAPSVMRANAAGAARAILIQI
jgi:hypothetical protein